MDPLERSGCFICRGAAVDCRCDLDSGRDLVIPLVFEKEPVTYEEGIDLWATYIERHPATYHVDVRVVVVGTSIRLVVSRLWKWCETNTFNRKRMQHLAASPSRLLSYAGGLEPPHTGDAMCCTRYPAHGQRWHSKLR